MNRRRTSSRSASVSPFPPRAIESLERRWLLAAVTAIVDDGSAGYADGLAGGTSLVATAPNETLSASTRDAAGNLHAVYDGGGGRVLYLFKPKGASAWTTPVDVGVSTASEPRLAVDTAGNVHVVYYDSSVAEIRHITRGPTLGSAWSAPVTITDQSAGTPSKAAIAADGVGGVHFVYQEVASSQDVRYRRWSGGAWGGDEVVAANTSNEFTPRVAAGTDGRASVVWSNNTSNNEVNVRLRDAAGVWGAVQRLDASTKRSLDPDVAMGSDNSVHVIWHEDPNSDWEITYAKLSGAGGAWTAPVSISTDPGVVDAIGSIAVGPDNLPRVSWMDYNSLYFAKADASGAWSKNILILEKGIKNSTVAVDGFNRAFVLAQAQKAGLTNAGSWDIWSYADPAAVVGRSLFYNNSFFDGNNAGANASDDNARATDKSALLPGAGAATFANYSSFSKGINGIMIDIAGLPANVSALSPSDFVFRAGNDLNNPSGWSAAPDPSAITIRRGAGVGGSDRVTLTWPDYNPAAANPLTQAVAKKWLQVTVPNSANSGLGKPDYFMFGNAVGETGNTPGNTFVDGADFALVRDNPRGFANPAPITLAYDINRDRFVDGADLALVRDSATSFATALKIVNPPAITPGTGASAWSTITGAGYQNDYRMTAAGGDGNRFATYSFDNLPAGRYAIEFTYQASGANATNVPILLSTGSGSRQTLTLNEQAAPSGTTVGGTVFNAVANIDVTGNLRVLVTDAANGAVNIDAIRVINGTELPGSTPGYDLSPDVVAAPNGDLHAVYHAGADTDQWYAYYIYKPAGGNWTAPTLIGGTGTVGGVKIARGPDGTLHVVYYNGKREYYSNKAPGAGWSVPIQIPGQLHDGFDNDIAVDANGTVHIVWHQNFEAEGRGWDISYITRDPSGAWSGIVSASPGSNDDVYPSVAAGADNTVHIAWQNYDDVKLHYRSRSATGVWSSEQFLDNESGRSNAPDLAVGPDNTVYAVWMEDRQALIPGSSSKRGWEIAFASKSPGGSWTAPFYFDHYSSSQFIDIDPAVGIGTDGSVSVTFSDYNDAYLIRRSAAGAWSPLRTIYEDPLGDVDRGAKANSIAVSPLDNSVNVMFMARTDGRTNGNSWDVFYYLE